MAGWWKNGLGINEREQEYLELKSKPKNETCGNEGEIMVKAVIDNYKVYGLV